MSAATVRPWSLAEGRSMLSPATGKMQYECQEGFYCVKIPLQQFTRVFLVTCPSYHISYGSTGGSTSLVGRVPGTPCAMDLSSLGILLYLRRDTTIDEHLGHHTAVMRFVAKWLRILVWSNCGCTLRDSMVCCMTCQWAQVTEVRDQDKHRRRRTVGGGQETESTGEHCGTDNVHHGRLGTIVQVRWLLLPSFTYLHVVTCCSGTSY